MSHHTVAARESQGRKQELRIKLDVSVAVDLRHDKDALAAMVQRAARCFMPNNWKQIHSLSFAEEADLYSPKRKSVKWTRLIAATGITE